MPNTETNANIFERLIKLSDRDQNRAWTLALIIALGFISKSLLQGIKDSYTIQLKDKDKTIQAITKERDEYKTEVRFLYKENERLYSNPTKKIDSVTTRIDKLIDKIEKK